MGGECLQKYGSFLDSSWGLDLSWAPCGSCLASTCPPQASSRPSSPGWSSSCRTFSSLPPPLCTGSVGQRICGGSISFSKSLENLSAPCDNPVKCFNNVL